MATTTACLARSNGATESPPSGLALRDRHFPVNVAKDPRTVDASAREALIRDLESSRIRALVDADVPQLLQLHAPDYQLVTPSGRTFTRERYVALIGSRALQYLRWDPGPMQVRASEAMAIVRYRVTLQLGSPDGPGTPQQCWHTDSYERIDGRWQAVWSQATRIDPE